MNLPDSWLFFDTIYCISINARTDRRQQARQELARVGLLERVEFIIVEKHPNNPEQGIFESHIHCINKGLESGGRHILIFEDDVFFQGFEAQNLRGACLFLENRANWEVFFLGGITSGSTPTETKYVVRVKYRCLAHAYAVNRPFAECLSRQRWSGIPFDDLLRQYNSNFFALYPMIAFQGLASTDNQTLTIDRMRRLFGGLPFIQKINEFFQNHKKAVISIHLFFLMVLTALTLKFLD